MDLSKRSGSKNMFNDNQKSQQQQQQQGASTAQQCPMENISTTIQSLDTVRALHQTVVSLRSALEDAKLEINRLRSQISVQSDIKEGVKERSDIKSTTVIENISKQSLKCKDKLSEEEQQKLDIKNEILTQQFIEEVEENHHYHQHHYHHNHHIEDIQHFHFQIPPELQAPPLSHSCVPSIVRHHYKITNKLPLSLLETSKQQEGQRIVVTPDVSIEAHPNTEDNKLGSVSKMGSKIDVKIKVMSKIKVDDESICVETIGKEPETTDKPTTSSSINLQTTTEDNIQIQKDSSGGYVITQSSKENINIDDENVNLQQSDNTTNEQTNAEEEDNSVFMEDEEKLSTMAEPGDKDDGDSLQELEIIDDDDDDVKNDERDDKDRETKEEVDDIELIFSSDETRDPIQEDLVSISEYDPWQQPGRSGTPVLVKFSSLPSTDQNGATNKAIKIGKLSSSNTCEAFLESESNDVQNKSIESTDSLENQISLKSSSLEKDNSGEDHKDVLHPLGRDESFDFFNEYLKSGGVGGCAAANRKWTNYNVLVETDISKCGIVEETSTFEMFRRNTCPNPPAYRSLVARDSVFNARYIPSRLASKYSRRLQCGNGQTTTNLPGQISKPAYLGPKRSSSAQTDISALPAHWKSESQLSADRCHLGGPCTLPSKFVPTSRTQCPKHFSRVSERTQETRRILLSDINFTSMVPELSRSADHLCQDENKQDAEKQSSRYYKGNLLKTPDYGLKGITPSVSMTSPGASQWTVNESSFGTQTIQTGESWGGKRDDSFDSYKSYSIGGGSRYGGLDRHHHRSRSVPSVRCAICRQAHHGIKPSESMHYTPKVTFQDQRNRIRGSLPDLRYECSCSRRYCGNRTRLSTRGDSSGSTESLLDEADAFIRKSFDNTILMDEVSKKPNLRRLSENDIQRDYVPSKQSLPFLPKTANCLKPGHLAKVISKGGRVVIGRVRYVGPLIVTDKINELQSKYSVDDLYVGVQLQSKYGDCDGTFDGRRFFECEPQQGLFVPFKKVIMAWTS